MKHLTIVLLVCSACWDAGPTPSVPDGVEIVFSITPELEVACSQTSQHIGDVAIGAEHLYAVVLQWNAPMDCGDGMSGGDGSTQQQNVPVHRVPLPETIGGRQQFMAGQSSGEVTTRVAASSNHAAWIDLGAFADFVDSPPVPRAIGSGGMRPTGFVADDSYAFFVATTPPNIGERDVNDPAYPCCFENGSPPVPSSEGWRVAWDDPTPTGITSIAIPDDLYVVGPETLKTALVANSTKLFLWMRYKAEALAPFEVSSLEKNPPITDPPMPQERVVLAAVEMDFGVPVGLAANDTWLAFTVSVFYKMSPFPEPHCRIFARDLIAGDKAEMIFSTRNFSCLDTAIDDTHVYFTIVAIPPGDGHIQNKGMTGRGLARVSLAPPHTFESVDLGIVSAYTGPRRIYLMGDALYAVDPFVIARLPKDALAGEQDFEP